MGNAVEFDGLDDFLTFNLPVNGWTAMTLVLVSANTADRTGDWHGAANAALFWNETADWGTVYVSPFQSRVRFRFGTGQANNLPHWVRPVSAGTALTQTIAIKNGGAEALYVDGQLALSSIGKLTTLSRIRDTGNLGRGYNDNTFFPGRIAEVLVYDRALTASERQQVEQYLSANYPPPAP